MSDTLSRRARTAIKALNVTAPQHLSTVSLLNLRTLPNCGPRTIREIVKWGGEYAEHIRAEIEHEEAEKRARAEAPHPPPRHKTDSERRAAGMVKVYPPSEEARRRWVEWATNSGLSLSAWLTTLAENETSEDSPTEHARAPMGTQGPGLTQV